MIKQAIVGYKLDEEGHWIAELACGHSRHVRHTPPMLDRPWVLTEQGREAMMGQLIDCGQCDHEQAATET